MIKHGQLHEDLHKIFHDLDDIGYKSMLLTFSSDHVDYLTQAARAAIKNQKTGLMFAVRPYAMSARFCSMIIKSFNSIINNVSINIIAGTFDEDANKFIENSSIQSRRDASRQFAKDLIVHNDELKAKTRIYFSGSSNDTLNNAKDFGDGLIILLKDYLDKKPEIKSIVRLFVIISESDESAKLVYDSIDDSRIKENSIYGTESSIIKQLNDIGSTDYLINDYTAGLPSNELNNLVSKYSVDRSI